MECAPCTGLGCDSGTGRSATTEGRVPAGRRKVGAGCGVAGHCRRWAGSAAWQLRCAQSRSATQQACSTALGGAAGALPALPPQPPHALGSTGVCHLWSCGAPAVAVRIRITRRCRFGELGKRLINRSIDGPLYSQTHGLSWHAGVHR